MPRCRQDPADMLTRSLTAARRALLAGAQGDKVALQAYFHPLEGTAALLDYVQALIGATRSDRRYAPGLSPRAGQGIVRAARAWAFLHGRSAVLPEDVQAVFVAVAAHRLQTADGAADPLDVGRRILGTVPIG